MEWTVVYTLRLESGGEGMHSLSNVPGKSSEEAKRYVLERTRMDEVSEVIFQSITPSKNQGKGEEFPVEKIAEILHKQWTIWMDCIFSTGVIAADGAWTVSMENLARWQLRMNQTYGELSQEDKNVFQKGARIIFTRFLNSID